MINQLISEIESSLLMLEIAGDSSLIAALELSIVSHDLQQKEDGNLNIYSLIRNSICRGRPCNIIESSRTNNFSTNLNSYMPFKMLVLKGYTASMLFKRR